ncbi:uncharacterized protein LOC107869583 [Capsicum annuum]|uniref:uncharacterized protein LOC107869583 n=1 Tax=Capsicum annuum TaxID=4072 RepID=UPI001FB153A0|nr:uncharacterized protein LOC107869583 [Capsicum annuum]
MMNAINENKKQAKGSESDQPPTDENVKSTSPHQATTKFVHEFNKNPEVTLNTLPDELLPSLNVYVNLERSIILHPSANQAQQTSMHVLRIRRPSRYNESPFTMKFGSADVSMEEQWRTFDQKHPFISHPVNAIEDTKVTNKFMTWLSLDPLKYHSKRNNKEEHYLKGKAKIPVINFEILSVEDKNWFYVMGTPSQT